MRRCWRRERHTGSVCLKCPRSMTSYIWNDDDSSEVRLKGRRVTEDKTAAGNRVSTKRRRCHIKIKTSQRAHADTVRKFTAACDTMRTFILVVALGWLHVPAGQHWAAGVAVGVTDATAVGFWQVSRFGTCKGFYTRDQWKHRRQICVYLVHLLWHNPKTLEERVEHENRREKGQNKPT